MSTPPDDWQPSERDLEILALWPTEIRPAMPGTHMSKAARLLVALAIVLVTAGGCGDLYCGVPKGDNVNILGDQNNG
jgi:hypothetical protein